MSQEFSKAGRPAGIVAEPAAAPESIEAEALVAFVTEGGSGEPGVAALDRATGGLVSRVVAGGEFSGKRYECVPLLVPPGLKAAQLLLVGLGKREQVDAGVLYRAAAAAARQLAGRPRARVAFLGDASWSSLLAEQAVAGAAAGMIGQDLTGPSAGARPSARRSGWGFRRRRSPAARSLPTGSTSPAGWSTRPRTISTRSRSPRRRRRSPAAPAWRS